MPKLIALMLLSVFIISNDAGDDDLVKYSYEDLILKYREAQRKKQAKPDPGPVIIDAKQWIYDKGVWTGANEHNSGSINTFANLSRSDLI